MNHYNDKIPQALFDERLQKLIIEVKMHLSLRTDELLYRSYQQVMSMLLSLNYSNKTDLKGAISHFVLDSYVGDRELGERLIKFDQAL